MTTLEFTSEVPATQRELFDFHMDFTNVRIVTPPIILTRFAKVPEAMQVGSIIIVEINQLGVWVPWEIVVQQIVPDQLLVDVQQGRGPFKSWTHEHRFLSHGTTSVLTDKIMYALPFGPLGALIDLAVMRFIQKKIFAYRHKKTIEYFLNR